MADLRPPLGALDVAFGVPALVTVPGGSAVAVTVKRDPPRSLIVPDGDLRTTESITVFGLRRDQVPSVPSGTTIVIGAETFRVDSILEEDDELVKVIAR